MLILFIGFGKDTKYFRLCSSSMYKNSTTNPRNCILKLNGLSKIVKLPYEIYIPEDKYVLEEKEKKAMAEERMDQNMNIIKEVLYTDSIVYCGKSITVTL